MMDRATIERPPTEAAADRASPTRILPVARSRALLFLTLPFLLFLLLRPGLPLAQEQPKAPPPAVTVVAVETADITPSVSFTGRIEAVDKVDLIARVDGFLEARPFTEGALVQKGDLLFAIEKGPYEAQLGEVDAAIAAAEASLKLAQIEVDRQTTLVQKQAAAQAVLDKVTAEADQARAAVQNAKARRANAELNLGYTDITAPFTGRIGLASVSVGAYVGPDSGPLATIVSQDPMYVAFPVTQRQLLTFREGAAGGDTSTIAVKVRLADGTLYDEVGQIDFVDVEVDTGTDSVTVRAVLANPNSLLIDQQLVTAVVQTAAPQTALLVPQQAVLSDQGGRFVLLVDADNKVEQRPIVVGQTQGGSYVVTRGLEAGDRVITDGIQRVRPGMVVEPGPPPDADTGSETSPDSGT